MVRGPPTFADYPGGGHLAAVTAIRASARQLRTRGVADPLVRFEGVSASYGGPAVLQDIDLDLARGALVGIVGPSGAGKTTLLRAMVGQVPQAPRHGCWSTVATWPRGQPAERRLGAAARDGRLELPGHGPRGRAHGPLVPIARGGPG